MRIVYMGTPDFAVPSLRILVENGYKIVGVITAPDKPKGRGRKLQGSPVKEYAESVGLKILQPANLKSTEFVDELKSLKADLQIVVAFRMLPEVVWNMPKKGTFNLHASLLPNYRGAAPINWAIINGEKETGITTFFLKHEIDTGDIILQEKEPIYPDDDAGSLYQRLMDKGSNLVLKTVKLIENDDVELKKQEAQEGIKEAPKIFNQDCEIDWSLDSERIINFIRGLSPFPGAWTKIDGKKLLIYEAEKVDEPVDKIPGKFETDNKTYLKFKTGSGVISIKDLKLEGKRRMKVEELLNGFNF